MKITVFLFLTNVCLNTVVPSANEPAHSGKVSSTAPITTTIKHPTVNVATSQLCKRCHCDTKKKTLDCSRLNLSQFFSEDDLTVLKYGDIQFETIRLDHNNLQSIPPFPALPVKRLQLNNNKIDTIEKTAFKKLTQLEALDLSHNQLSPKSLFSDVFEGSYNPSIYDPLAQINMKELNLGYNQLHSLDPDVFEHFPKLENLSLASNPFHIIDHLTEIAISSLRHLKSLDLSYMQLSSLPPHLLHPPKELEILQLTGNLFTQIPDALTFTVNLKNLNLDENLFKEISGENVFPRLLKLETLSLSYMPDLTKIGKGALSNLGNLKQLICTNNPLLSSLHPNAFGKSVKNTTDFDYPPLEKLFLHNNNLTLLDKALLGRWDKLNIIDIRENPWRCDCDNHWMIHSLYPQIVQSTPVLSHGVDCASPEQWHGVPIHDIYEKKNNLRCTDTNGNNSTKDGAMLIGMLIGLFVSIPLTFAVIIIWRKRCFGLFARNKPTQHSRAFYEGNNSNFGEEF